MSGSAEKLLVFRTALIRSEADKYSSQLKPDDETALRIIWMILKVGDENPNVWR